MYLDGNSYVLDSAPCQVRGSNVRNGSRKASDQELIESHLHLVHAAVAKLKRRIPPHIDAADLYSIGLTGLVTAVRKFNPIQGRTFAGFAALRIRGAMLDELRRMDSCSRRARARARQLKRTTEELEQKLGRTPTAEEMRAALSLTKEEYVTWVDESRPITLVAFDRSIGTDDEPGGASLHDLIADQSDQTGASRLEQEELVELLTRRLGELPPLQRKILSMYYFEDMRISEIASAFGVTSSRISQVHTRTLTEIRGWLLAERSR